MNGFTKQLINNMNQRELIRDSLNKRNMSLKMNQTTSDYMDQMSKTHNDGPFFSSTNFNEFMRTGDNITNFTTMPISKTMMEIQESKSPFRNTIMGQTGHISSKSLFADDKMQPWRKNGLKHPCNGRTRCRISRSLLFLVAELGPSPSLSPRRILIWKASAL